MADGILRNSSYFPTFSELIWPNTFSKNKTWCILAEIVDDKMASRYMPPVVKVKDRSGCLFEVVFFGREVNPVDILRFIATDRFLPLRNGSTICIRYPDKCHHLDMSEGVIVLALDFVKVIPVALNELLSLSDDKPEARINAATSTCWNCNKPAAAKCSRCTLAVYCSKECQKTNWASKHKKFCKILPDYMDLIDIDFYRNTFKIHL